MKRYFLTSMRCLTVLAVVLVALLSQLGVRSAEAAENYQWSDSAEMWCIADAVGCSYSSSLTDPVNSWFTSGRYLTVANTEQKLAAGDADDAESAETSPQIFDLKARTSTTLRFGCAGSATPPSLEAWNGLKSVALTFGSHDVYTSGSGAMYVPLQVRVRDSYWDGGFGMGDYHWISFGVDTVKSDPGAQLCADVWDDQVANEAGRSSVCDIPLVGSPDDLAAVGTYSGKTILEPISDRFGPVLDVEPRWGYPARPSELDPRLVRGETPPWLKRIIKSSDGGRTWKLLPLLPSDLCGAASVGGFASRPFEPQDLSNPDDQSAALKSAMYPAPDGVWFGGRDEWWKWQEGSKKWINAGTAPPASDQLRTRADSSWMKIGSTKAKFSRHLSNGDQLGVFSVKGDKTRLRVVRESRGQRQSVRSKALSWRPSKRQVEASLRNLWGTCQMLSKPRIFVDPYSVVASSSGRKLWALTDGYFKLRVKCPREGRAYWTTGGTALARVVASVDGGKNWRRTAVKLDTQYGASIGPTDLGPVVVDCGNYKCRLKMIRGSAFRQLNPKVSPARYSGRG